MSETRVNTAYKWKEISDLPPEFALLRDRELEALLEAWSTEKDRFSEHDVRSFTDRLSREWAIETGVIENVYTLERGVTQTLIDRGIDSSFIPHNSTDKNPELVALMIQAHAEVLEGLFDFVKGQRILTVSYIKELHSALLRHQRTVTVIDQFKETREVELIKGTYKLHVNNPVRPDGELHEYCPPEHVASEMDRLVEMNQRHNARGIPIHVEAAWLHHAFTQIHPFQDGNGRVARTLASLIFIKAGYFPLVVNRNDWENYIAALEVADTESLAPLVSFFARNQKRSLTKAIGHVAEAKPVSTVDEAVQVTRDLLVNTGRIVPREYLNAKEIASRVQAIMGTRMPQVVERLTEEITKVQSGFQFNASTIFQSNGEEFKPLASVLDYDANFTDYCFGIVVRLVANHSTSTMGVIVHGVGPSFRGLLVVVSYFKGPDAKIVPICDDLFRISYKDTSADVEARFGSWLESSLIRGLAEWRKTLV